jgi:hypothetical protein
VVGLGGDDDAAPAGVVPGHAQGQVVGFGAGAGEHGLPGPPDPAAVGAQQVLGVVQDARLQVAGVGAERAELAGDGLGDPGVGVPHRHHVVVGVQVVAAVPVVQQHAAGPGDLHRMGVEQPVGRAEQPLPPFDQRPGLIVQVRRGRRVERIVHLAAATLSLSLLIRPLVSLHGHIRHAVTSASE